MKYTSKSAIAAIELNWIELSWTETQKLIIRQNYSQYWADHSFCYAYRSELKTEFNVRTLCLWKTT